MTRIRSGVAISASPAPRDQNRTGDGDEMIINVKQLVGGV